MLGGHLHSKFLIDIKGKDKDKRMRTTYIIIDKNLILNTQTIYLIPMRIRKKKNIDIISNRIR